MLRSISFASLSVMSVLSLGCSFQPKEGAGATGTGTGSTGGGSDASPNLDRIFMTQDTTMGGESCPSNSFTANNLPPDLLIVLDRSGSMNEDPMTGMSMPNSPTNKWAQTTTAINQVVGSTQDKVRWGLKLFASAGGGNMSCNVNAMAEVPPGPMNAAAIAAAIANTGPGSSTPTRAAETQAAAYLRTVTDVNPKYILLATDGQPNCRGGNNGSNDDAGAIMAVMDVAMMGLPTFVIGIATTGGTGDATLSSMAVAGGHPRANGPPSYYPVTTAADLSAALGVIQGMTALPCQFQLTGVPSNPGGVSVTVGGQPVATTDWMFGMGNRSIVFPDAGAICSGLKAGTLKDVLINLPCGDILIP